MNAETPKTVSGAESPRQKPAAFGRNVLLCAALLFVLALLVYWYTR